MPEQYSTQDLAGRIKAKYPAYADMDDQELVSSVIKKHPKYQTALTTEALQQRTAETLPSREETERAYTAAGPQIKPARKGLVPWLERAYGKMMYEGIPSLRIGGVPVTPKMPALTAGAGGGQKPPGQPSIAEVIAGPALGTVRAATGLARITTQPTPEPGFAGGARGLTEILHGGMQAAPLPFMRASKAALPAFIPPFELATRATRRAVEPLPISPESKELASTVIPLVGGAAIAGAPAIMRRGQAARARAAPVVEPPPPRRLGAPTGPEIGIQRELPGGVMRPVPPPTTPLGPELVLGRQQPLAGVPVPRRVGKGRTRAKQPTRQEIVAQEAWKRVLEEPSKPAAPPVAKPLPKGVTEEMIAAETSNMKSRGLGQDRPTAIATVKRMQAREAEAAPIDVEATIVKLKEVSAKAGETGERVARREITPEQGREELRQATKSIAVRKGERLAAELERPPTVLEAIRKAEEGRKPVFDEFGDEIVRGKTVVDPMGRTLKVESVNPEKGTLTVRYKGRRQETVKISDVTVKRHGKQDAMKGIGRKAVRYFGESQEAFEARAVREGGKLEGERGFLRAEDVLPIEAIRDFVAGMKEIGKGITARFKGRGVRAPSKRPAQDLADDIDVVATKLTRDAEMLLEQMENIAETGTFQPGPPGRGARAERAERAPIRPALKVSEQMVKDLNAQIVATARAVKELRTQAEITGSAGLNKALRAAEAQLETLAERYRPLPKAAGRAVKAFDYPVPQEVVAELQRVGLFLKNATKPGLSDYIFEAWVNFLLSGPKTHLVNSVSNTLVRLSGTAERAAGATVDLMRAKIGGTPREVFFGEVAQEVFGLWRGIKEGARIGLEAWRTEAPVTSKLEIARHRAIPGRAGRVIRTPGRALIAADEFFKAINRRVEINARAYRAAAQEGKVGVARAERIAQLIEKPTPEMLKAAEAEMLYRTFQQPFGPWSRHIASMRTIIPGMRYIVPFLRTPINIAKFSLERTPLNFIRLAQMIAKGELKGGELSAEVAKPVVGTVIGAAIVLLAAEGKVTGGGPRDRGKRRVLYDTGWQPYSLKIGDTYYSYNRFEPVGALFGMAADYYETFDERAELEQTQIIGRMVLSISRNITSKTYLRGVSDAMNAVSDPERYSSTWLESISGTVIPTIVAEVARARDPFYREPTTALEAIKARIPGLSRQVQPKRGVFGQPARRQGGFARRFFVPPIAGPVGGAPERELARLGMGVSAPGKRLGIRGRELELSPEEYGRLQETGGGFARTMMERLVGRAAYQRMSDEERERVIKTLFTRARGAARGKMIRSIPRPQLRQRYAEARR